MENLTDANVPAAVVATNGTPVKGWFLSRTVFLSAALHSYVITFLNFEQLVSSLPPQLATRLAKPVAALVDLLVSGFFLLLLSPNSQVSCFQ
jgi:hypothetical protein